MATQVKQSGSICGAFTPVKWLAANFGHNISDPSGRTCLFSLVNTHDRPVRLRLQSPERDRAIFAVPVTGPIFGSGMSLLHGDMATGPVVSTSFPGSFELDQEAERAAGLPRIPFALDNDLLAASHNPEKPISTLFDAAEIECYAL